MTEADMEEIAVFKSDCERTVKSRSADTKDRTQAQMFLFFLRRWPDLATLKDIPTLDDITMAMNRAVKTNGNGTPITEIGWGKFKMKGYKFWDVIRGSCVLLGMVIVILLLLNRWDMDHIKQHLPMASEEISHD